MESGLFNTNAAKLSQFNSVQQQFQVPLARMHPVLHSLNHDGVSEPLTIDVKSIGNATKLNAQNSLLDEQNKRAQLHHKRKSDVLPNQPAKQFISEEKISAHFNSLHISSNDMQGIEITRLINERTAEADNFTNHRIRREIEEKLKKAQRFTICDEAKKMHEDQSKTFLSPILLNRIEKPCTAIVPWQRPAILELLQIAGEKKTENGYKPEVHVDELEDTEADDIVYNNNSCNFNLNNLKADNMDTDL